MVSFFNKIVDATSLEQNELFAVPQIVDAMQGNISRASYVAYLEQAYHHVKHTVPLMMLAGARMSTKQAYLRDALVEYIEEEAGHEAWILRDIGNAGGDVDAVRYGNPNIATEVMLAYAYDYISRVNPAGFFGMVYVLEGTSIQLASSAANTLQNSLGLPAECFSYLSSHGELDQEHMKYFENLVNRIEDESDQAAILHMAKRIYVLFANVLRSIPHKETMKYAI